MDGLELLRLGVSDDNELLLSVELRDKAGSALAVIDRNEWVSGDPGLWDLRSDHDRLKVWLAERRIALDINARATPVCVRADLWHNGQLVRLNPSGISWAGRVVDNGGISDLGLVGMSLEISTGSPGCGWCPYLGQGVLVSESDRIERLRQSINAWRRLTGNVGDVFAI